MVVILNYVRMLPGKNSEHKAKAWNCFAVPSNATVPPLNMKRLSGIITRRSAAQKMRDDMLRAWV